MYRVTIQRADSNDLRDEKSVEKSLLEVKTIRPTNTFGA
jgi:hypothetical protein